MKNLTPDTQPIPDQAADSTPQPTQTISAARLAANRFNATKSTGPRTPAGKIRSASNSLQHGLYSLKNFDSFIHDNDLALSVITNFLDQFQPVTPSEHVLVHQVIHQQLRFLQMEFLFNQAMSFRVEDILKTPVPFMAQIMRELDRLPARIQRTLKAIHAEQRLRLQNMHDNENLEIEPIPDQPPLPERGEEDYYEVVVTPAGKVACDNLPKSAGTNPPPSPPAQKIDGNMLFRVFAERILDKYGDGSAEIAAQKLADEAKKLEIEPT